MKKYYKNKGFSLVEILLAIAVFALSATSIIYLVIDSSSGYRQYQDRSKASQIANEGVEAVRNIRDAGWTNLVDGTYGLAVSGNEWVLSGTSDIDPSSRYTRTITISTIDADQKLITVSVNWKFSEGRNNNITLTTYLTNWAKMHPQPPNWNNPTILGTGSTSEIPKPTDVFVQGNYAYVTTLHHGSPSNPELFIYDISDPANPVQVGLFNTGVNINAIYVVGDYAYLATDNNQEEVMVLKVNNPKSISKIESINTPDNSSALDIFVLDNYVYATTKNNSHDGEFYIYDGLNPENISSQPVREMELGADGRSIWISGDFAYIGTNSNTQGVKVANISDKSKSKIVGDFALPGSSNVTGIHVNGSTIHLGKLNDGTSPEFFVLDANTSNPNDVTITQKGSLEIGKDINGIYLDMSNNQIFLATGLDKKQLDIIDISNTASPVVKSSLDLSSDGIALYYNGANVYMIINDPTKGLIIIGPGI